MIKSVNQLVTYECNSRCNMCLIWTYGKDEKQMSPEEFEKLYRRKEFRTIEDLCISGGEPTLRTDLTEIMDRITPNLPKLKMLFLSTNCSFPDRTLDFVKRNALRVPEVYAVVSLEGDRETHKKIRGVDSYDQTIDVLYSIKSINNPRIKSIISTTLQPRNCNSDCLEHVRGIAEVVGSGFTFRPATKNEVFYANQSLRLIDLTIEQMGFVRDYINKYKSEDPFMKELSKFLGGEETIMGTRKTEIKCLAGKISVFIMADGTIYPCINSTRVIGDKNNGLYSNSYQLGDQEPCPCCTECQIYPMLNYGEKNDRRD